MSNIDENISGVSEWRISADIAIVMRHEITALQAQAEADAKIKPSENDGHVPDFGNNSHLETGPGVKHEKDDLDLRENPKLWDMMDRDFSNRFATAMQADTNMQTHNEEEHMQGAFDEIRALVHARASNADSEIITQQIAGLRRTQKNLEAAVREGVTSSNYLEAFNAAFAIASTKRIRSEWKEIAATRQKSERKL